MKEKKGWLRHFVFVGVQLIRTYGTEGTVAFSKEKKKHRSVENYVFSPVLHVSSPSGILMKNIQGDAQITAPHPD